jgi:PAS domain S-box-containing protein
VVHPFRKGQTDTGLRDVTVGERSYQQAFYYSAPDRFVRIYGFDITGRKQVEAALQRAHDDLQAQSEELRIQAEELQAANEELRKGREDLDRAQAVAHTGSWRLDVRRNELLWSNETHRMFGIPREMPLTYEAFVAAVHPDDRRYVDEKWTAALRGEPYDIEHRILVADAVKWVRERAELEFDQAGALLGGFGTVQDITERKQAEEALRELNATLESRVAERTAELERRARQLQHLALELSQAENRERRHLAEILHDDLQQILVAAKFHVGILGNRIKNNTSLQKIAGQLNQLLDEAIDKSRSLSHEFSPAVLYTVTWARPSSDWLNRCRRSTA